ncbi:MAG TPA: hypothetical protein VMT15_21665 [Bryobacteraceae bacterium]|nr:hypothetical protein [Bryobacteraceae bacterium]
MRLFAFLLVTGAVFAGDELTVYDLLAPETHKFAIIYDVSATREGAPYYLNPIRPGSVAEKERVIDRASGQDLKFDIIDGKTAKAEGIGARNAADADQFLRVHLLKPVAKGAETRIRIYKTYTDSASYFEKDGNLVWARPLGIKRNVVILPQGYELIGSASPAIVSTDSDGRVRLSFLNDRDDQLPVKITARRTK